MRYPQGKTVIRSGHRLRMVRSGVYLVRAGGASVRVFKSYHRGSEWIVRRRGSGTTTIFPRLGDAIQAAPILAAQLEMAIPAPEQGGVQ